MRAIIFATWTLSLAAAIPAASALVHAEAAERDQAVVNRPSSGIQGPLTAGSRIWHPKPAGDDAPTEAARVRIVGFGNDFLRGGDGQPRHHFHCHRYRLYRDDETGLWSPGDRPLEQDNSVDIDGDGHLDDVIAFHEFSLERPFNAVAPWYDTLAGTPRWYGGQAIYQANTPTSGFSEDGVNQDHDGQFAWPRENWAVFHETFDVYSPYRLAANWLWLKHDFLNGGARYRVTFDDQSRLALVLKRYFMGVESVRFLVRDGRQCYLSEATSQGVGTHTLHPNQTRWALYNPRTPHDIYFDASQAEYESHDFRDVTGVGVYCSKDRFIPAYFGYKWYSFECDAVVHRARRPSELLAMACVDGGAGVGEFYIAATEVPYELWKTSSSNTANQRRGIQRQYRWGRGIRGATRGLCGGRRAACTASLYVDVTADGFRLPRVDEFQRAAIPNQNRYPWGGDPSLVFQYDWLFDNAGGTTHPVGEKKPNALGLYDVLGNVSELSSACADDRDQRRVRRLGGSLLDLTLGLSRAARASDAPPETWPYCDTGFRVVRQVQRQRSAEQPRPVPPGAGQHRFTSYVAENRESHAGRVRVDLAKFNPLQGQVHRGNLYRDGVFQASGVLSDPRVKWSFKTDGAVKSSPVVVDDVVYFGSYDGSIYAADAASGEEVWRHKTEGPVSGSAAIVDDVVNITDGKLHWKLDLGNMPQTLAEQYTYGPDEGGRIVSSPWPADGVVFVGCDDGCLYAVEGVSQAAAPGST